MSTGYSICPLDLLVTDEEAIAQFQSMGLTLPRQPQPSRSPTVHDFRAILESWEGYDYGEDIKSKNLCICVNAPDGYDRTFVYIDDYEADQTEQERIDRLHFNNGSLELLVALTERLTKLCGPLLLIEDGLIAIIVTPGTPPDAIWTTLR